MELPLAPTDWPAVPAGAVERALACVVEAFDPDLAVPRLQAYYDTGSEFAGASFTQAGPVVDDDLTPADLLALTLLGLDPLSPRTVRLLTEACGAHSSVVAALRAPDLAADLNLATADGPTLAAMYDLHTAVHGVLPGRTDGAVHALCARKRPRLFPVGGAPVWTALGLAPDVDVRVAWQVLRAVLNIPDVVEGLHSLFRRARDRSDVRLDPSVLRRLDVVLWMHAQETLDRPRPLTATPRPAARLHGIGEVLAALRAEFPDLTVSKVHFLEAQGLLTPERTPTGFRRFRDGDVDRLRRILELQREQNLPFFLIKDRFRD